MAHSRSSAILAMAIALASILVGASRSYADELGGIRISLHPEPPSAEQVKAVYERELGTVSIQQTTYCSDGAGEACTTFRAQTFKALTHERYPCGDDYAEGRKQVVFVPMGRVAEGAAEMERVKADAKSGRVFECRYNFCRMMVESSARGPSGEKHYALCDVTKISNQIGAPRGCHAVAIESADTSWIRVDPDRGRDIQCLVSAFMRPTGTFGADYSVESNWKTEFLLEMLTAAFRESPPRLEVTKAYQSVIAVASNRVSPYVPPYRELVEVRSGAFQLDPGKNRLRLEITLLVSRQNPGSLEDYHLPNEAQRQVYLTAIKKVVRDALEKNCKRHQWADDYSFRCR